MLPFQSLLVSCLFLSWGGLGFDERVEAFYLSEISSCIAGQSRVPRQSEHVTYEDSHCPAVFRHLENVPQNCSIRAGGWTVEWTHSGMGFGVCGDEFLLFCYFCLTTGNSGI